MRYILASASPRRKEILGNLGLDFTVLVADADETCDITDPGERVEFISLKKCLVLKFLITISIKRQHPIIDVWFMFTKHHIMQKT